MCWFLYTILTLRLVELCISSLNFTSKAIYVRLKSLLIFCVFIIGYCYYIFTVFEKLLVLHDIVIIGHNVVSFYCYFLIFISVFRGLVINSGMKTKCNSEQVWWHYLYDSCMLFLNLIQSDWIVNWWNRDFYLTCTLSHKLCSWAWQLSQELYGIEGLHFKYVELCSPAVLHPLLHRRQLKCWPPASKVALYLLTLFLDT